MRIAIITDAWEPQVNGVVRTLGRTAGELADMGFEVKIFNPSAHRTVPLPSYPEIRLALFPFRKLARNLDEFRPEHIHIATEGPLGLAGHRYCRRRKLQFTTAYHTQFPEYVRERFPVPVSWTYRWMRRFHGRAAATMVPTPHMANRLRERGFENVVIWERGVDTELFRPDRREELPGARPIWIYVGRVAVEKNLAAFLDLELPGSKVVVGDGPQLNEFREKYTDVEFMGYRFGEELAAIVAGGDVFVFPSLTDTYGLVMLEAMACGLPVAAFPVTGPVDVVKDGVTGVLDEDLGKAALQALELNREACRQEALERTWRHATEQFASHLVPARSTN